MTTAPTYDELAAALRGLRPIPSGPSDPNPDVVGAADALLARLDTALIPDPATTELVAVICLKEGWDYHNPEQLTVEHPAKLLVKKFEAVEAGMSRCTGCNWPEPSQADTWRLLAEHWRSIAESLAAPDEGE